MRFIGIAGKKTGNNVFFDSEKFSVQKINQLRVIMKLNAESIHCFKNQTFCCRNIILLESGLMERELQRWYVKKPKCIAGKTLTKDLLVSIGIKEVVPLLGFLLIGFIFSSTILIIEIIVHRHCTRKRQMHFSK